MSANGQFRPSPTVQTQRVLRAFLLSLLAHIRLDQWEQGKAVPREWHVVKAGMHPAYPLGMSDDDPRGCVSAVSSSPRLLERIKMAVRLRHYSARTEEAYLQWIRRYIVFHGRKNPAELGGRKVTTYLTSLVKLRGVSASTQNQARAALIFLYAQVLLQPLGETDAPMAAKRPERLPVVLAKTETAALLGCMTGITKTIAYLLYGSGFRLFRVPASQSQGHRF